MKTRLAMGILISLALVICGCTGAEIGYSTWSNKNTYSYQLGESFHIPDISFEYPYDYHKVTKSEIDDHVFIDIPNPIQTVSISFVNHVRGPDALAPNPLTNYTSSIDIYILFQPGLYDVPEEDMHCKKALGKDATYSEWRVSAIPRPDSKDSVVIDRISVGNHPAFHATYPYTTTFSNDPYGHKMALNTVFERDDYVIVITAWCWEGEFLKVSAYYNHLLETFEISG